MSTVTYATELKNQAARFKYVARRCTMYDDGIVQSINMGTICFQARLRIVFNSKNEAARFKHAAQRCKKYHESMTTGNNTGTVLL